MALSFLLYPNQITHNSGIDCAIRVPKECKVKQDGGT